MPTSHDPGQDVSEEIDFFVFSKRG